MTFLSLAQRAIRLWLYVCATAMAILMASNVVPSQHAIANEPAAKAPAATQAQGTSAQDPLSAETRAQLAKQLQDQIETLTDKIAADAKEIRNYSRRGDAYFFLGQFKTALADYDKMAQLDPTLADSHWRRGLACYYAGAYADAAGQFERCFTLDDSDRENGIWRFFAQVKTLGLEKARQEMLVYTKEDREPLPGIYDLFAGRTTPEAILKKIEDEKLNETQKQQRLFYAHLYIGLHHALADNPKQARAHLSLALQNPWALKAGYGPNYMWHIARLQYDLLTVQSHKATGEKK